MSFIGAGQADKPGAKAVGANTTLRTTSARVL
jgi:hypothetical protein